MFSLFLFLFGLAIGSFLNVLIDRWSNDQSIHGRSRCDHCHHQLAWYDLIPIVSFLLLGGKCRYCKKKLSWQYPIVEITTGVMFMVTIYKLQPTNYLYLWAYLGIMSCLIVIFFSDAKYHIIPDQIQVALLIFSLIVLPTNGFLPQLFLFRIISAFAVMLPILLLYWLTHGKGMGFGDVKLSFIVGFLLGMKLGFIVLYFAFIMGAIIGLFMLIIRKRKLNSKIAFGPFIVLGILLVLYFQIPLLNIIKRLYGF